VRARRAPSTEALAGAQGAVWGEINALSAKLGVRSSTGALDEAYTARRLDLEKWAEAFPPVEGQVGLLALTPREAVGLDVVGSPELYRKLHTRLLNGYLMDGFDRDALGRGRPYRFAERGAEMGDERPGWEQRGAARFMRNVMRSERVEAPTVGFGRYSVLSRTVVGGELLDEERLVHLSAFPVRDVARERGLGRRLSESGALAHDAGGGAHPDGLPRLTSGQDVCTRSRISARKSITAEREPEARGCAVRQRHPAGTSAPKSGGSPLPPPRRVS